MKVFTLLLLMVATSVYSQNKVGFQSITRFDNSRPAVEEQRDKTIGRIIQLNIWYPTEAESQKMSFRDYVGLAGLELDSSRVNNWYEAGVHRYFAWPESVQADKKSFTQVLDYEYGLSVLQKEFPVVTNDIGVVGFSFGGQSVVALKF